MSEDDKISILPPILDPGETKTIEETAKAWGITVDAATKLGGFFSRALGTIPQDALGLIIGDWLHQTRIRTLAWHAQKTEEILRERGIEEKTEPISPSIAIPLLQAAQDETREELKEVWNTLITNAMDPNRSDAVRRNIIETVKQFEPIDALVLKKAMRLPSGRNKEEIKLGALRNRTDLALDGFDVSVRNLIKLDCFRKGGTAVGAGAETIHTIGITSLGREITRACGLEEEGE